MLHVLLFLLSSFIGIANAADCSSPLAATQTLLDNLQSGEDWRPAEAAECFPPDPDAEMQAIQLKQVLDARGLLIDFNRISSDPDYTDDAGDAVQVLHVGEPRVRVVKTGSKWVFSPDTVAAIPSMYSAAFSGLARTMREALPGPFHKPLILGLQGWQLVLFGLLILVSFLAGRLAHLLFTGQVVRIAQRLHVNIGDDVVTRLQGPLTWTATGAVFLFGIPDLQFGARLSQGLHGIARLVLSIAIVLVFMRVVDVISDFLAAKAELTETKLDDQLIPLANRAMKVVVVALGALSVLDNLGIDVTSLLAGVTISGLAIALAAKDTVENLFGSVMIFVDRPFQIGDYIQVGGMAGTVEEVGFRSTRLRTLIGTVISVPNGKIATAEVDNFGLREERRLRATLGFTYDAKREQIADFCTRVRDLFETHEQVVEGYEVEFVGFGDSALEVMLHAFLEVEDWSAELSVSSALYMEVWKIAEDLGLNFAYPSQSLYVESLPASS